MNIFIYGYGHSVLERELRARALCTSPGVKVVDGHTCLHATRSWHYHFCIMPRWRAFELVCKRAAAENMYVK
jgi:hypothetical protein